MNAVVTASTAKPHGSTEMYFASATRIFHNGNFDSGEWYGGWTSLSRETRKHLTIDGEPVVEVDSTSLLTLLSVSQVNKCNAVMLGMIRMR